ncbi:hypothetical protein HMSSN139_25200 [Paenibacillus sp. HMSSN-139]|nr:hypothetical protein HMSSN139_25200 [Paenibacillus sp. HMSSN-139]
MEQDTQETMQDGVDQPQAVPDFVPEEEENFLQENYPEEEAIKRKREAERSDNVEESVIYWQQSDAISRSLTTTKHTLKEVVGLGESFDVVFRDMTFGGKNTCLFFINGFARTDVMQEIIKRLTYLTPENLTTGALRSFFELYIPHIQVEKTEKLSDAINKTLTGMSALFIEGEQTALLMDTRQYPVRSPEEPSLERVVRGSRDGFTETLVTNITLVRRRLRDPGLKLEMVSVGRRTRTDVCIAYIDDIVDKTQVDSIREKIKAVNIDGIPLADKQLEEAIIHKGWNPYPLVRYSERPDVVASHLLEGRVVLFVDTSPSVMILPTTFLICASMRRRTGRPRLWERICAGCVSSAYSPRYSCCRFGCWSLSIRSSSRRDSLSSAPRNRRKYR